MLYIHLPQISSDNTETHYTDIRITVKNFINKTTKIIGHTHNSEQDLAVKSKDEEELLIDTSPRNSIAGTLFLSSTTNLIRDRAKQWKRNDAAVENWNLGCLMTFQTLLYKRIPRIVIDGDFIGLINNGVHLDKSSVFYYNLEPTRVFVLGGCE